MRNKDDNNLCKGFSLMEILVAIFVFSLVMASVSGLFVASLRSQRKTSAIQEILNQTSYAMEYMSRALRMARKDDVLIEGVEKHCLGATNANFSTSTTGIKFRNYKNECQEFYLEGGQLKENKEGVVSVLTSSDLMVNDFNIGPGNSWDQEDADQPRVTIYLRITGKEQTEMRIQTTVSQRSLDVAR